MASRRSDPRPADRRAESGQGKRWRPRPGEAGDANEKNPFATENVAETAPGDKANGVGQAVSGDDKLDLGERSVKVRLHGRQGKVNDEEVKSTEEGGGEDDGERKPAAELGR